MNIQIFILFSILNASVFFTGSAYSQALEVYPVASPIGGPSSLKESFDPKVSNPGVLLGYRIGTFEKLGTIDSMLVALEKTNLPFFCVRIKTLDARFSALNKYIAPDNTKPGRPLRLSPISYNYTKQLQKYISSDFALSVFQPKGKHCHESHAIYYPQVGDRLDQADHISILVNSESQAAFVQFVNKDSNLGRTVCTSFGKVIAVAFDKICTLTFLPSQRGKTHSIRLILNDGFDETPHEFDIFIPAKTS